MKPFHILVSALSLTTLAVGTLLAGRIAAVGQPAQKQYVTADVGKVDFATTCTPEAGKIFNLAMAFQHDYWFTEARRHFDAVLQADPTCAIAYWGLGNTLLANAFSPTPTQNLPAGLATLQKGITLGAKSQRENDLLRALAVYYTDYDKLDENARIQAYGRAMKQVAARYPDDDEVQIAYALALLVAASPTDFSFTGSREAAAILEKIGKRRPDHPGVAHFLIHAYDSVVLAPDGLYASRCYPEIAPMSPHARHMPSHTFTRMGHWRDSIAVNIESVKAARAAQEPEDELHSEDYLVYAYLQTAQDEKAARTVVVMRELPGTHRDDVGTAFALAASPARYRIERNDWKGAARLELTPTIWPYADSQLVFARAVGAARSGDAASAQRDMTQLAAFRDRLSQANERYWANQVDIQFKGASAWTLWAAGNRSDALKTMTDAARQEDGSEKHALTPGPVVPARELLGDMLLEDKQYRPALIAYEETLTRQPRRYRALAGAAHAAVLAGDKAKAQKYFGQLLEVSTPWDTERPEIPEARAYIAANP
jgi:tetratricopeptide (TPR) repeat protein